MSNDSLNPVTTLQCADCGEIAPADKMGFVGGVPFCKICNPALAAKEEALYDRH